MYFKLAFRNVKSSFKNYMIYFLTLTFGVCIFYIFNSIESQSVMLNLTESKMDIIKNLTQIMGMISVFVSFVLGFLIIYANNFLIKRRKKELGIYMTLGMDRGEISRVLLIETFIIGLFSLLVGLLFGTILSQGLAVITAKIFEVDMTSYKFVFSSEAAIKLVLYFGIIFLLVMLFNFIIVSKYKLIDLIYGEKKNQSLKTKNITLSVVIFILSIIILSIAYYMIIKNGLTYMDSKFLTSIILGCIGTLLFFMGLSGFILKLIQSNKRIYYKGLNSFILRQINSKINTNVISMSIICLMLFFTICILSGGIATNKVFTADLEKTTPYDATVFRFIYKDRANDQNLNLEKYLENKGININSYSEDYIQYRLYSTNIKLDDLLKEANAKSIEKKYGLGTVDVIKLSDYNKLMKMQDKKGISLDKNQFSIIVNSPEVEKILKEGNKNISIDINEKNLKLKDILTGYIEINTAPVTTDKVVVNDDLANGLKANKETININYKGNKEEVEKKITLSMKGLWNEEKVEESEVHPIWLTKIEAYDVSQGMTAIISFVSIYIGLVFLMATSAILALQQLSEITDSRLRYDVLRKIGVDEKTINKSLFTQIGIYFFIPLSLAIIHSIVGIKVMNSTLSTFTNMNILGNVILTAGFICIVYGGYFLATYFGSKSFIKG